MDVDGLKQARFPSIKCVFIKRNILKNNKRQVDKNLFWGCKIWQQ